MTFRTMTIIGSSVFLVGAFQSVTAQSVNTASVLLPLTRLRSELRPTADAVGRRLSVAGAERTSYSGAITRAGAALPILVITELPSKASIQFTGTAPRTIGFDGSSPWAATGAPSSDDLTLIETMVSDSTEQLLFGQIQNAPIRFLGSRFRIDGGTAPSVGPLYDVFQLSASLAPQGMAGLQPKLFFINSKTHLLELVRYDTVRNSAPVKVEIQLGGWTTVAGQYFPYSITRIENGVQVFAITFTAATSAAAAADAVFLQP